MWPHPLPSVAQSAPVAPSQTPSIANRLRSSLTTALARVTNRPHPEPPRTASANRPLPERPRTTGANRPLPELPRPSRANRPLPPLPETRISAASTVPHDLRATLAEEFQIWITPLRLDGVELGLLFSPRTTLGQCILLCARVEHPHDTFDKPHDVALAFAAPWGENPDTGPLEFAQLLRDHEGNIPEGQFWASGAGGEVPDYPLFGIPLHLAQAAEFVSAMGSVPGGNVFDLLVLNRHAEGITLADLLRAIRQERQGTRTALVCHFDRDPLPGPRAWAREGRVAPLSAR